MTIALTTMAAVSLAILVYIVVVIIGTYTTQNISSISNTTPTIARSLDYVHKSDISIAISSVVGALSSANFLALGSPLVIFFHGL
jgi:hypothetical protein